MTYKNISKTYNKKILDDITLDIEDCKITSIIGESGCGKTTLLKIMAGILEDDKGTINNFFNRVGYVPQGLGLLPWRTVRKNIEISYEFYNQKVNEDDVLNMLNLLKLKEFENYKISELSGGMKQRVAIGRALVTNPDIIFLDEPFRSLDELNKERLVKELVVTWRDLKKTVVFVTHSISEAIQLSDKIIVMSKSPSKILFEGKTDENRIRNILFLDR